MAMLKKIINRIFGKGEPYLIFIVEDDVFFAKTLEHYLKRNLLSEHEIMYFPVGELALENFHLKPDLIILDYHLNTSYYKAANGLMTVKKIKSKYPKTEVILVSSQKKIEVAIEAIDEHACSYVIKNEEAMQRVAKIINHKMREKEEKALILYDL
jgi:DNA-binding NtrC family response regulator